MSESQENNPAQEKDLAESRERTRKKLDQLGLLNTSNRPFVRILCSDGTVIERELMSWETKGLGIWGPDTGMGLIMFEDIEDIEKI